MAPEAKLPGSCTEIQKRPNGLSVVNVAGLPPANDGEDGHLERRMLGTAWVCVLLVCAELRRVLFCTTC